MSLNLVNNYIFQQLFLVNPKKGEQSSFSLSRMQLQTRSFSRCVFQLQSKTIHTHTCHLSDGFQAREGLLLGKSTSLGATISVPWTGRPAWPSGLVDISAVQQLLRVCSCQAENTELPLLQDQMLPWRNMSQWKYEEMNRKYGSRQIHFLAFYITTRPAPAQQYFHRGLFHIAVSKTDLKMEMSIITGSLEELLQL